MRNYSQLYHRLNLIPNIHLQPLIPLSQGKEQRETASQHLSLLRKFNIAQILRKAQLLS